MRLLILILFSFTISLIARFSLADDFEEPVLPEIWPAIRQDKSYHLMYQLWMQASSDRLVIEEWASFDKKLFRLDLIAGDQRTTYLSNGNTGEVFRFKPFVCDQLTETSNELSVISQLFKGFGLGRPAEGQRPVAAYGLGPLWMRASADATGVRVLSPDSKQDMGVNKFLKNYVGYELSGWSTPDQANNDFNLRFYFRKSTDTAKFVDSIEWVEPTPENSKKRPVVVAHTKTILLDTRPIPDSKFALPIGFGCQRAPRLEVNGYPEELSLDLLHDGGPNQALLEITTSSSTNDHLNKWTTQRYLVRLMRGSLELGRVLRNYYVATVQYRDELSAELVRYKRIWSSQENANYSLVYTIKTGNPTLCSSFQMQLNDLINLKFPNVLISGPLNMEFIKWVLKDKDGYHLLREQVMKEDTLKNVQLFERRISIYEKRLLMLKLTNFRSGPVSIVKKVQSLWFMAGSNKQGARLNMGSLTTITLFFYSDNYEKILAKAKIESLEMDELDITTMHEQMDIGLCLDENKKQEVTIKYPMESRELSNALQRFKQPLQEQLLVNLFGSTTIELLQVTDVTLTFDDFFMYLNMRLLDLPLRHAFEFIKGFQLEENKQVAMLGYKESRELIEINASKFEKCAQACDHYDCKRFSYDWVKLSCRIELVPNSANVVETNLSEMYEYKPPKAMPSVAWEKGLESIGASRVQLNPQAIIIIFNELLTYEGSSQDEVIPLQLRVLKARLGEDARLLQTMDDVIELKPASVQSEIDYIDELSKNDTELQSIGRYSSMKVEYAVVCNGFHLGESTIFDRIEESSYEECAKACESANCRSFSFDVFKLLCLLSQVHSRAEIIKSRVKETSSTIYHVNYLSKFESIGLRIKPVKGSKIISNLRTHQDCASACMEESEFSCQGIYNCPKSGCILTSRHVMDYDFDLESKMQSLAGATEEVCFHYARSFLAQFDQYYGRALNIAEDQQVEILDFGAEKCAQSCIHHSCLAFHVCNDQDESKTPRQHCLLATHEIKRSNVEKRKHCYTYVLSDRSQFNLHKRLNWSTGGKLRPSKPAVVSEEPEGSEVVIDKEEQKLLDQDINKPIMDQLKEVETLDILAHPSWAAGIVYILLGILLGMLGTYIWQEKKGQFF